MEKLELYIESLIFASDRAISIEDIRISVENYFNHQIDFEKIKDAIDLLKLKYSDSNFSFEIIEISNGYIFSTKAKYHDLISDYLKLINKTKLSKSALETLAIIAYNQPVTKPEIEKIRGVNCDYAVKKLLDKEIIEIKGREEGPGKPLLYITNEKFLDYLGIKNLDDLPDIKEFKEVENNISSEEE